MDNRDQSSNLRDFDDMGCPSRDIELNFQSVQLTGGHLDNIYMNAKHCDKILVESSARHASVFTHLFFFHSR